MEIRQACARPLQKSVLRTSVRICELALLLSGCLAAAVYVASVAISSFYQTYASERFDEAIHEKNSTASELLGFFSILDVGTISPTGGPGVPGGNSIEWSQSRLRAYRKILGSPSPAALARLQIPSVGLSVMVFEGTDAMTLNRGVGRIEGTARPGEAGNVGLAGHRDSFFRCLERVSASDEIILTTSDGRRLRYAVDHVEIVEPGHVEVLEATANQTLTLVTCYPFYFIGPAPLRYVVKATGLEDPERSGAFSPRLSSAR